MLNYEQSIQAKHGSLPRSEESVLLLQAAQLWWDSILHLYRASSYVHSRAVLPAIPSLWQGLSGTKLPRGSFAPQKGASGLPFCVSAL